MGSSAPFDVENPEDLAAVLHDTSCRCTETGGCFVTCWNAEFYRRWVHEIRREISERVGETP